MTAPPPEVSDAKAALLAMAAETAELEEAVGGTVSDTLAGWLAVEYVRTARRLGDEAEGEGIDVTTLRGLTADVVALRKGDHSAARLRIDRERLEIEREQGTERRNALFEKWLKKPGMLDRLLGEELTDAEKAARIREVFGLPASGEGGISDKTFRKIERALRIF